MSLHKLTAGDGYTYLTRQVAAADATHRGRDGLSEYYSEKGESPGVWLGQGTVGLTQLLTGSSAPGAPPPARPWVNTAPAPASGRREVAQAAARAALVGVDAAAAGARAGSEQPLRTGPLAGSKVTEAQMLALFGQGRHPDAEAIESVLLNAGQGVQATDAATRLGSPYRVATGPTPFRVKLARRYETANADSGLPRDWPIPQTERAAIRTELGREMFTAQYGRAPMNSRELSGFLAVQERQKTSAVAGYDLTFTPVKSVSALWAVAPKPVADAIEQAHQAAVEQTLTWLEDRASHTRLGRNGTRHVDVRGLIAAAFTHRDSRAGDPNLHTHVAISNKVQVATGEAAGRWLALDGVPLHKLTVAASERYNTRLEALLRDKLGVEFTERPGSTDKRPVREVVGVDERLLTSWSARRAMVDVRRGELAAQFQARHGRPPGAVEAYKLAQQATLETRQAKHEPRSHAEQRQLWRADALGVLGSSQALAAMLDATLLGLRTTVSRQLEHASEHLSRAAKRRGGQQQEHPRQATSRAVRILDTPEWVADSADQVLQVVQTGRATWQEAHVRAEAERAVRAANLPLAKVDAAVERVVAAALSPAWSLPLRVQEPVSEPAALRRRDGTSVYERAGMQMFTSPEVVAAEQALLALAQRTGGRTISPEAVELAMLESSAAGVTLNPGQVAMLREFTGSGRPLQLGLAPAGTGKTVTMRVVSSAWRGDGGEVLGLAPSAAAAAILGTELSGDTPGSVHTDTLAKLIWSLDTLDQQAGRAARDPKPRGPVPDWVHRIGPDSLVVLDEAGMAGTPDLARAAEWITSRGASLRLVGDDAQLAAVGAGGVLRDIAETAGALTLSQVVRFHDPAEGAASLALRAGERAAIGFYIDHDRVHVGDPSTGVDAAYRAWQADRRAGRDSLMLAPTRAVAAELNARARADRLTEQHPSVVRAGLSTSPEVRLSDGSQASAGDTIVTRRNNRRLAISSTDWVKNGDRWTVRDVRPDGALKVAHVGTGRVILLPADYTSRHVALGYASTVHAAQGSTADTCHTVATGSSGGGMDRQLLYVAMTRGRASNHLYLSTAGDGDEHSVITPDAVLPLTAVDLLTRIVDRDGAQVSATTAQKQLADPATRLGAAADRYHDSLHAAALSRLDGPDQTGLQQLDQAAEQLLPGLTNAAAWPTLCSSLALHAALHAPREPGPQPGDVAIVQPVAAAVGALRLALAQGEMRSAGDPAAVLDWRLDLTRPVDPTSGQRSLSRPTRSVPADMPADEAEQLAGPLAWLPAIPTGLQDDHTWGTYLMARSGHTLYLADQVADRARTWTSTSAPGWASPFLGADDAPQLLADLAVWRAGNHVDDSDLRPTGPRRLPAADLREQHALDARVTRAIGDPAAAANRWRTLAQQVEPRLLTDPYWPVLADRLAAAHRAGIDVETLVHDAMPNPAAAPPTPPPTAPEAPPATTAATTTSTTASSTDNATDSAAATQGDGRGPLPDEMPAAALWWRLSRQLAPAALSAQASDLAYLGAGSSTAPSSLRPVWTPHLVTLLGDEPAARIVAAAAWPALVAAVTTATATATPRDTHRNAHRDGSTNPGWTPEQVLDAAHELLQEAHRDAQSDMRRRYDTWDTWDTDALTADGAAGADPARSKLRPAELATALVWRVAMLTTTPHAGTHNATAHHPSDDDAPVDLEQVPLDPHEQEFLPPDDLHDGYDAHDIPSDPDAAWSSPGHVDLDALAAQPLPQFPADRHAQHDESRHTDSSDPSDRDWAAAPASHEPPNDPSDEATDTGADVAEDWLALAPVLGELAGKEQLWQPNDPAPATPTASSAPDAPAGPTGPTGPTAAPVSEQVSDREQAPTEIGVSRERLLEVNAQARDFYAAAYAGSWAQQHLQQRLGPDLAARLEHDSAFRPGYAPAGWTHLIDHLRESGATDVELLEAGLAIEARTGRLVDRFRDRLVLPIQTLDGRSAPSSTNSDNRPLQTQKVPLDVVQDIVVVGFVGRRHPDAVVHEDGSSPAGPKYLNTADTAVFTKGSQLYGLAEGRDALAAGAVPVLVEGPVDALAVTLASRGAAVGVAPLGTALTNDQADTLRPHLTSATAQKQPAGVLTGVVAGTPAGVLVATDADAAGRKAAEKAYWKLASRGGNPGHLQLPDGLDPAALLTAAGPEALRDAVLEAQQPDSTLARTLVAGRVQAYGENSHWPEKKVLAIRAAAEVIGALPPTAWLEHIAHLDSLVDAYPGVTHMEVLDAGLAWAATHPDGPFTTPGPATVEAHTATRAVPTAQAAPTSPAETAAPEPTAPQPTAPQLTARAGGTVDGAAADRVTAAWAAQRWRDVGVAVDPRLVAGRDWPRLAVALERAFRAGYDVQQHLPRLAALEPLPDTQPSSELRSRLVREVPEARTTATAKVRRAGDRQRIADAAAARSRASADDQARRDTGRPVPGTPRGPRPGA